MRSMNRLVSLLLLIAVPYAVKAQSGTSFSGKGNSIPERSHLAGEAFALQSSKKIRPEIMDFPKCLTGNNDHSPVSVLKYMPDSIKRCHNGRFYPELDPATGKLLLRNQNAAFGRKMLRGTLFVAGYDIAIVSYLLVAPERISKWDISERFKVKSILHQYHLSYTSPPVIDKDLFVINYIGHPLQGSFMYNAVRSQGAEKWQSALYCTAHSVIWEYVAEGGFEQPSIQDLIVTPVAGVLLGELCNYATLRMSRNGFKWYEAVAVTIINPMYAMNNGFRIRKK
jgi:hypothetical protein